MDIKQILDKAPRNDQTKDSNLINLDDSGFYTIFWGTTHRDRSIHIGRACVYSLQDFLKYYGITEIRIRRCNAAQMCFNKTPFYYIYSIQPKFAQICEMRSASFIQMDKLSAEQCKQANPSQKRGFRLTTNVTIRFALSMEQASKTIKVANWVLDLA